MISNNVPGLKSTGESSNELGVQAFQFLALKVRKKKIYSFNPILFKSFLKSPILTLITAINTSKNIPNKKPIIKITVKKCTEGCQQTNKMIYWNNGTHRGELKMEK